MKARALKSFKGRYGHVRAGIVFNCEPGYFAQLAKSGLVEKVADGPAPNLAPTRPAGEVAPGGNMSIPEAPGKAERPANPSEAPPAGGKGQPSVSLRQALRSRGKTSKPSDAGEKPTTEDSPPAA